MQYAQMLIITCFRPTLSNPHPFVRSLIRSTSGIWKEYVEHDFVVLFIDLVLIKPQVGLRNYNNSNAICT